MRTRTTTNIVLIVASVTVVTTLLNLRGNLSLLAKLPEPRLHHVEAARLAAESTPFTFREHRMERKPRLEAFDAVSGRS